MRNENMLPRTAAKHKGLRRDRVANKFLAGFARLSTPRNM
jgi:hypothetical protein